MTLLKPIVIQFNVIVGGVAFIIPLIYLTSLLIYRLWSDRPQNRTRVRRKKDAPGLEGTRKLPSMTAFKAAKSFQILSDPESSLAQRGQLGIETLRLPPVVSADRASVTSWSGSISSKAEGSESETDKMSIGYVDLKMLAEDALSVSSISATAQNLYDTHRSSNLPAIAIRCDNNTSADQVNHLLEILYFKGVPVIILAHHDMSIWDSIDLGNATGVIVESACILPNGERRDYFKARPLQTLMSRCSTQRETRPDFFVGFMDLWEKRPHPSIIRRSVKLAEHFGAVMEHGPIDPSINHGGRIRAAATTLSGFEYLRRGPLIDLQKFWSTETRKVRIAQEDEDVSDMAVLPLDGLKSVIPKIDEWLAYEPMTDDLIAMRDEEPTYLDAPPYEAAAPFRENFWDISCLGQRQSQRGCYPIASEPTAAQYDAVVKTQTHLKELGMLQPWKGAEIHRLVTALRTLTEATQCHELVHGLIEGLQTHRIAIYKGLDTGFGVADGVSYFWGVSNAREEKGGTTDHALDIFVSLKVPNDATTILHTWLAHHGLPRVQRFEMEHEFERANNLNDKDIPISLKTGIERLSHAETLNLIQQIRVSQLNHPFCDPLIEYARVTLIDDASRFAWYHKAALNTLADSMSIREIFQARLEHFARAGANFLPTVDGLVALYEHIEVIVEESLFFGDREPLNVMTNALLEAWDPETSGEGYSYVDVNADLFALIFFTLLRKAAFEDVYIEATDRCPFFLSLPDQAAVFSELWVLGSQCEIYFGILPRALGAIVYRRYRAFLGEAPPSGDSRKNNEVMTMYSTGDVQPINPPKKERQRDGSTNAKLTGTEKIELWRKRFTELGAMSIFCLPAIIDVILLTFVGRGVFMTAFMEPTHLQAASLALLISLLLTSGVTGWVGSVGNYYLVNFAYDNMIYFHVERLSGGFVISLVIAVCGIIGFSVQYSVAVGFIFAAYLMIMATYFNLLGIMSTMHQHNSPLTSGRTVLWRTFPLFLVSPLISALVNGYDLPIYLSVTFTFVLLAVYQYRRLCQEWSSWMQNIPKFSEKDVMQWYESSGLMPTEEATEGEEDGEKNNKDKNSQEAFRVAVAARRRGIKGTTGPENEAFVTKVAAGMPYIDWLLQKTCAGTKIPDVFSASWFTQLGESIKQQKQLARGLKEHNVLLLFRFARYDLGQNLGLFLVALMDRWVAIVMGARLPHGTMYLDSRSRYGLCFCVLYFCASVMVLDTTLQKYWEVRFKLSGERLVDYEHAKQVSREWESKRLKTFGVALRELFYKIFCVFGLCTLLLWLMVDNPRSIILYYCYILGYTCVILFQFNRCFTTNVRAHITIILSSAAIGFIVGCILRAIPSTAGWLWAEVMAQNVAAVLAAIGTTLWSWKDWSSPTLKDDMDESSDPNDPQMFIQTGLSAEANSAVKVSMAKLNSLKGTTLVDDNGSFTSSEVAKLLRKSMEEPNMHSSAASWSDTLLQRTVSLWTERRIIVTIASRQQFVRLGMEDIVSVSQVKPGTLEIAVGFLGDSEVHRPSWQPLLASLITEAMFYHVARAELHLTHAQAVRSEHFLHDTRSMSKRLDFELAFADAGSLTRMRLRTNVELMKHLCLDVAVDAEWESMPQCVREAVINRITGDELLVTEELTQWVQDNNVDISTMDFHIYLSLSIYQRLCEKRQSTLPFSKANQTTKLPPPALMPVKIQRSRGPQSLVQHWLRASVSIPFTFTKWVAIISGAGPDIERELWYCLKDVYFNRFILRVLLQIWRFCCFVKDLWVYLLIIYQRPTLVSISRVALKGSRRKLLRTSIVVELPRKTITGFSSIDESGAMKLDVFDGACKEAPSEKKPLFTATYDSHLRLRTRCDNGITSTYNYPPNPKFKWPLSKELSDEGFHTVGFYDKHGRISRGTLTIEDNEFAFQYHYKATPKGNTDILSADFKLINDESDDVLSVFWGVPVLGDYSNYDWVPSERISRLVKVIDGKTYVTEAEYRHRRDPLITTYLQENDGRRTAIARSPKIFNEEALFLARPNNLSFDMDDLLVYHNKLQVSQMRRHSGRKPTFLSYINPVNWIASWGTRVYLPIPTWQIRTELWNLWLKTDTLDAPTACWLDELVLREEPRLRAYWHARNSGQLREAKQALDKEIDQIVSAIDIQTDVSEVCLLPIRTTDLYTMGLGKDATQVTTRPEDCFNDTKDRVSVIFNDIGCWPEAPGGVSNCRRDLVNGHSTIRNHVLAECANDFGIPRFQVEKNVQSMKLLPLWGLDGKSAYHGLIDNLLQSQVDEKVRDTDVQRDIVGVFIPLLKAFVKGARTRSYSRADLIKYTNVMLSFCKYYERKDYSRTWSSPEVEQAWVDAWLVPYDDPNIIDPAKAFDMERPTMADFRDCLGIYLAYFFIFSVKIPERCPRVFQSTHHGISSLFGMILRYRRGTTFGIWDHAILWRECCLNISPAQCELPISVQTMLLSGIGLATRLAYFHADVIMPCTSLFNPMWEAEIGTDRGMLGSKTVFNRRIDPIVNGISNMESFTPVDKVRTEKPTVVMLSNVQSIKGIKTAILAANIIVNKYGFKDYSLVVYGAKDRQPSYALEMAKLIVENNLSEKVILAGFGKPKEVLKDAWLFMNSSISEGLPLAIGEAALAGVPIVATEVGATALVMTDPDDQDKRYGEVVPPNDPLALARAQLSILGMVGPWAKFTEEATVDPAAAAAAVLPDEITPADVDWLTKRMYAKVDDRRKLGLLSREVVLHSFHGNRYLREHEQMYWIQWHIAQMRDDKALAATAAETFRFGTMETLRYTDEDDVSCEDEKAAADETDALLEDEENQLVLDALENKTSMDRRRLSKRKTMNTAKRLSLVRWQDFNEPEEITDEKSQAGSKRLSNDPHQVDATSLV
ncbi:unnamed protein product [Clonostachys chloroleuca]|uniref:DUF3492 domain-containing protein n=1 Tax=Clonostachys chloroleuca TaxID=1926264 RepID=A0AA35Q1T4_9HYPO|nr:unnamed protein product [Clonostachys chloroleuca]